MSRMTMGAAAAALMLAACGDAAEDVSAGAAEDAAAAAPATGESPLPGWVTIGDATWTLEGGEVVGVGAAEGASFLATQEVYEDFNIKLEFMITNPGNSGVYFRCEDMTAIADTRCYEANIFDDRPDQSGRTGAIVNIAPPQVEIDGQDGQWHSYDITMQDGHITVVLDGQTTVDVEDDTHTTPSPIALQLGQGDNVVRFRNIEITPL